MYVALTFLLLAVVTAAGNTRSMDERYRLVLWLSIAKLIILRLYKFSLKNTNELSAHFPDEQSEYTRLLSGNQ